MVVGLPLEMVHGSLRIAAVYMAGVLAGELYFAIIIITAPNLCPERNEIILSHDFHSFNTVT